MRTQRTDLSGSSRSSRRRGMWPVALALAALWLAALACSADDVIGQRGGTGPTATIPSFATATPGGRISVWLVTPTGQAASTDLPPGTPTGKVIAPAASATAALATIQAATATAGATVAGPVFQPNECPDPGSPAPPPKPVAFGQYPERIGLFLSAGGPPTILEATLRSWGALTEGANVQSNVDLTGDGIPEVIVTFYDPVFFRQGAPSPGQMLVYGCSQKGYRLLYSTDYSPNTMIPEIKRVGDMNSDLRAKLAFAQQICVNNQCTQIMQILAWNSTLGVFRPLNAIPVNATNAKIAIADLDGDGILEVSVSFNPTQDPSQGPQRKTTDIWDWDGQNYVLALTQIEAPIYRVHALYDGDVRFNQGNWREAIRFYDRVRDDNSLQAWTIPNELETLRAYATYKKYLSHIANRATKPADDTLAVLLAENPGGTPGEGYAAMGQAFSENYKQSRDRKKACGAALGVAASRPDVLTVLNSFGPSNRTYSLNDLCPFVDR